MRRIEQRLQTPVRLTRLSPCVYFRPMTTARVPRIGQTAPALPRVLSINLVLIA
jgi:hypothetical protein